VNLRKRLPYALGCFAVLAIAAGLTLDGHWRLGVWAILLLLAVKFWLDVKRTEAADSERDAASDPPSN
jgi:hypothetical protein